MNLQTTVYYDVRLRALLPNRTKTQVYLYIDVEAQNAARESRLGYPLEKRAIYYMSRMISNQLQTVSKDTNYNVIQKVYSIWICMGDDIPKKNYDLMSAVFIRLGHGETDERLIGMLQTIFTDDAPPEKWLKKLETGKYKTYYDLISDGTLTLKQAAKKCSLSPDEFQKKLIELKITES